MTYKELITNYPIGKLLIEKKNCIIEQDGDTIKKIWNFIS